MKKILFVIISVFLIPDAFPQLINVEWNNISFENRKKEGYFNVTQFSFLTRNKMIDSRYYWRYSNSIEMECSPSLTMTNGWIFNEHVAAGVGVGIEKFDRILFPVFVDIRYTLWDNKISPFFAFKTGHAFCVYKDRYYYDMSLTYYRDPFLKMFGGFMLNPEMGIKIPLNEKADLLFTVGYHHQKTRSEMTNVDVYHELKDKESLNRLSFGMAVMFR